MYTAVQQLTRFQLTQRVARSLCGSWASRKNSFDRIVFILIPSSFRNTRATWKRWH